MSGGGEPAMSTGGLPAMSPGGGPCGLAQMPVVWPAGITHTSPVPPQQSDVAVHLPPSGTQVVVPHTNLPDPSGMQVLPLQQSAEVAHVPPAATHIEIV